MSAPTPRIAVDAMGGDHAPEIPVEAAFQAARQNRIPVTLVGNEAEIGRLLSNIGGSSEPLIEIMDAPEVVSMQDSAVMAVRQKRRASIPVSLALIQTGACAALVSAGNTGAVVAAATLSLGRIRGVSRPGIAIPIPTHTGAPTLLIDAGAIVDPRPEILVQHARLASAYVATASGVSNPRVGLISNGEESGKGNALARAAFELLEQDDQINFTGNVESQQIATGVCDVIVTDGFTGNVILKTAEGIAGLFQETIRSELKRGWYTSVLGMLLRPAFRRAGARLDYREYGGAPLLGVDGLVYIAHGRSDEFALLRAIQAASSAARNESLQALRASLDQVRNSPTGQL